VTFSLRLACYSPAGRFLAARVWGAAWALSLTTKFRSSLMLKFGNWPLRLSSLALSPRTVAPGGDVDEIQQALDAAGTAESQFLSSSARDH
jgi:hypothetical protein